MVVLVKKSQSHPDLVVCASPRWNLNFTTTNNKKTKNRSSCSTASLESLDSESSLVDVHNPVVVVTTTPTAHDTVPPETDTSTDTKSIGRLLWKLLLTKRLSRHATSQDWIRLQEEYPSLARVTLHNLQRYHAALSSIVIMDPDIDDRVASLLHDYHGHLVPVSRTMTEKLLQQAPENYKALVGDFNDNLAYSMQSTRGIPTSNTSTTTTLDTVSIGSIGVVSLKFRQGLFTMGSKLIQTTDHPMEG